MKRCHPLSNVVPSSRHGIDIGYSANFGGGRRLIGLTGSVVGYGPPVTNWVQTPAGLCLKGVSSFTSRRSSDLAYMCANLSFYFSFVDITRQRC